MSKEQKQDRRAFQQIMDRLDKTLATEKLDPTTIASVKKELETVEVIYVTGNNRVGKDGLARFEAFGKKLKELSESVDDVKKAAYVNSGGIQSPRADRYMPKNKRS